MGNAPKNKKEMRPNQFKCFLKQEFTMQSKQIPLSAPPKITSSDDTVCLLSSSPNQDVITSVFKLFMLK